MTSTLGISLLENVRDHQIHEKCDFKWDQDGKCDNYPGWD